MKQKAQNLGVVRQPDTIYPGGHSEPNRRVTGSLDISLDAEVKIFVEEYWYITDERQRLVIPTDRLFSSKRILLEQGKTVASAMTNKDGSFAAEWLDPPIGYEQPWRTDVYLVDETYQPAMNLPSLTHFPQVTAYRVLTLRWFDEVQVSEGDFPRKRYPTPIPTIMFFGDEKEKDIGQLFGQIF